MVSFPGQKCGQIRITSNTQRPYLKGDSQSLIFGLRGELKGVYVSEVIRVRHLKIKILCQPINIYECVKFPTAPFHNVHASQVERCLTLGTDSISLCQHISHFTPQSKVYLKLWPIIWVGYLYSLPHWSHQRKISLLKTHLAELKNSTMVPLCTINSKKPRVNEWWLLDATANLVWNKGKIWLQNKRFLVVVLTLAQCVNLVKSFLPSVASILLSAKQSWCVDMCIVGVGVCMSERVYVCVCVCVKIRLSRSKAWDRVSEAWD